jgi:hypothetical protein
MEHPEKILWDTLLTPAKQFRILHLPKQKLLLGRIVAELKRGLN